MSKDKVIKSQTGKAIVKIKPMFSSPGVIREYRLQPQVLENFDGEDLWTNVDYVGFFGREHPERYKELPEAEKIARDVVDRVEKLWAD